MTLAESCKKAQFTSDQLDDMGCLYREIENGNPRYNKYGWVFPDGSAGYYDAYGSGQFEIIKT